MQRFADQAVAAHGGVDVIVNNAGVALADRIETVPLADFEWSFNPSIKKKQIFDLATCRFIREARSILWLGPPGTGKTHTLPRTPGPRR